MLDCHGVITNGVSLTVVAMIPCPGGSSYSAVPPPDPDYGSFTVVPVFWSGILPSC